MQISQRYANTIAGVVLAGLGLVAYKWNIDAPTANALIGAGLALCGTGYGSAPAPANPPSPPTVFVQTPPQPPVQNDIAPGA